MDLPKLTFHGSRFLVTSSSTRLTRAASSRGCCEDVGHVGRLPRSVCPTRSPDWSAGCLLRCIGLVLPVCPCVVSFSKLPEPDTHDSLRTSRQHPRDMLATSSQGCHEDATRKLLPWNFNLTPRATFSAVDHTYLISDVVAAAAELLPTALAGKVLRPFVRPSVCLSILL